MILLMIGVEIKQVQHGREALDRFSVPLVYRLFLSDISDVLVSKHDDLLVVVVTMVVEIVNIDVIAVVVVVDDRIVVGITVGITIGGVARRWLFGLISLFTQLTVIAFGLSGFKHLFTNVTHGCWKPFAYFHVIRCLVFRSSF